MLLDTDGMDWIEIFEMFLFRRGEIGDVALVLAVEKEWGVIGEEELEEEVAGYAEERGSLRARGLPPVGGEEHSRHFSRPCVHLQCGSVK